MLTVGSLFSGIGGIELGLERTNGFKTIWNCELDEYASKVLKKHWANVPNLGDITQVNWSEVEKPDLICGGFPCQDISIAGKGVGLEKGKRSGLWKEFAKAVRILRPEFALVENVSMLVHRGLDVVLRDLAEAGYDAEWFTLRASDVGAPHKRERIFIVAHFDEFRRGMGWGNGRESVFDFKQRESSQSFPQRSKGRCVVDADFKSDDSNNGGERVPGLWKIEVREFPEFQGFKNVRRIEDLRNRPDLPEPLLRRNRNGISIELDENKYWKERLKCLGNAVVPACAQLIGEAILEMDDEVLKNMSVG